MFDEGMQYLNQNGLPGTCYFLLSTKSVGASSPFAIGDTLAGAGSGEITGTGYTRQFQARPSMSGHTDSFSQMTWSTGANTDWPSAVRSIVLVTTTDNTGKMICAANLQSGGGARDLSGANTTEKVTPSMVFASGN